MRVTEICRRGYFDSVFIEGFTMPTYDNVGIEIKDGESIIDSLNNVRTYGQGVCKLRINIVGESTKDEDINIDKYRNSLGLIERDLGKTKRFNIGYVDILIVKDDCVFDVNVTNRGNTEKDVVRVAKCDDELELMIKAIDIKKEISKENRYITDCSVAIIDKIFINNNFRRCGIATWVHNNIRDLVKIYGMMHITAVLLIPGDFTGKANSECNMSTEEYKKMLDIHYKALGYKYISRVVMCKRLVRKPTKYMIGFDN